MSKTKVWKLPTVMSLQVNNPGQNSDISTFMNEKCFCQGCDWFLVCCPRRRKSNEIIFGSFRTQVSKDGCCCRQVSCSETLFFFLKISFANYDTFAKVLIIMNGLLFFLIAALLNVNEN